MSNNNNGVSLSTKIVERDLACFNKHEMEMINKEYEYFEDLINQDARGACDIWGQLEGDEWPSHVYNYDYNNDFLISDKMLKILMDIESRQEEKDQIIRLKNHIQGLIVKQSAELQRKVLEQLPL